MSLVILLFIYLYVYLFIFGVYIELTLLERLQSIDVITGMLLNCCPCNQMGGKYFSSSSTENFGDATIKN